MSSANPGPMWCTRRSENRFTVLLPSAAGAAAAVVNEGVWQWAQPIWLNRLRPFLVDVVAGAGVGGAEKRMKFVNCETSLIIFTGLVSSKLMTSSVTGL